MKWDEIGSQPCSVARALSVLGDRWTMLIIRNAFVGMRRFEDFQQHLGVTRHVLSDRLKRLVEQDILVKQAYFDRQQRFEYRLTPKGQDLYPILLAMTQWADRHMDHGLGSPVIYQHQHCGQHFTPLTVCSVCGEELYVQHIKPIFTQAYFTMLKQQKHA